MTALVSNHGWSAGRMCGIVGWMAGAGQSLDESALGRACAAMAHRGPDGEGRWTAPTPDGRHQIAFAHRRLSIIDLGGGHQPMRSADGQITVTFNGEIYNYIELRDELRARGHAFRTDSDTEVLIEAYRAWGIGFENRLRGMFAFALYDAGSGRVLLARDPFGKKPLFLAEAPGRIAFASEIPALLALPGVDDTLDWTALDELLVDRWVHGPATLFKGIRKLPPGCRAIWERGALRTERYFVPPVATTTPDITDFGEAVRQFGAVFDEAVRLRMRSDAPFGAFLSGGIDSSAVVAVMARHSRTPVRTFAVGFAEAAYSELDHARLVAEQFGTDHTEVVVTPSMFLDSWGDAVRHRAAPVTEMSDVPILLLAREARRSVKMVLTGEGSDEFLAGYPKHRAERWFPFYHSLVPRSLHERVVKPAVDALPYGMRRLKIVAGALSERDPQERMRLWFGGASPEQRDRLLGRTVRASSLDPFPFSSPAPSGLRRTLFFDQTAWLPDNLLERGDRMMMAASVEGRMPFMDVELARFAARLPDRFLSGHPKGKAVLRAAAATLLPDSILQRKKNGFRVPMNEWLRGDAREQLHDCLLSSASETRRLLDGREIDRLARAHLSGAANHEKLLWSLMNVELFLRTFRPSLGASATAPAVPAALAG